MSEEVLLSFIESVNQHVAIMNATVNQRTKFKEVVKAKPQLLCVDLPSWAGLGCALFIPELYRMDLDNILLEDEIDFNNQNFLNFLSVPKHLLYQLVVSS